MRRSAWISLFTAGVVVAGIALAAPQTVANSPHAISAAVGSDPHRVGHVFIIMLENKSFTETFGAGAVGDEADDYLRTSLPAMGALLNQYHGTSHFSHSNYVTLTSGQPPNVYNQVDCTYNREFEASSIDGQGIAHGIGCVFPKPIRHIGDQLKSAGKTWKSYAESMNESRVPNLTKGPGCRHVTSDSYDASYSGDFDYAPRHVPFLYFHSTIDAGDCRSRVVDHSALAEDLSKTQTTPNYSFIVPNMCHDGHASTCVDGAKGGVVGINRYLRTAVPLITDSPAFKEDGLLLILFDEAEFDGSDESSSGCCDAPLGPNSANLGGALPGAGGGRTGAVAISPFIAPGTTTSTPYNHYSTLRTVEDMFAVPHLGYAANDTVRAFGSDVFTR